MRKPWPLLGCLSALLLVSACANAQPSRDDSSIRTMPSSTSSSAPLQFDASDPLAPLMDNTGSIVGQRIKDLAREVITLRDAVGSREGMLQEIRATSSANAQTYYSSVGAIDARLQQGTTPGNPILLRQWDEAQANLDAINTSISQLNTLSTEVSGDASMANYLLQSINSAYLLSGALDEDHDQLDILKSVVNQQIVGVEKMRGQVTQDLLRMTSYINNERSNLQTLAFSISKGEKVGVNLANRPLVVMPEPLSYANGGASASNLSAAPYFGQGPGEADTTRRTGYGQGTALQAPAPSAAPAMPVGEDRTLVVIRFNQPNIDYARQLYDTVSSTLDQNPAAQFTVQAVAPSAGDTTDMAVGAADVQRYADGVKRALIEMGLPPNRIAMTSEGNATATVPEVHVLVH